MVAGLILFLSLAHFLASPHDAQLHGFLFKATFLPLVLAGLWFGLRGALVASAVTAAIYLVHVWVQLVPAECHDTGAIVADVGLLIVLALIAGVLSDRRVEALDRERARAEELEGANRRLLRAEEALRRSDRLRALGELSAGLAHEIRNPLGGIRGAAEILVREDTSPQARGEFADVLRAEVARLDRVVAGFLDFARPPQGKREPVDVGSEARTVGLLVAGQARSAGVCLEVRAPEGVLADGDGDLLRQALLNLVLNAMQAAGPGGSVRIAVKARDPVAVEVVDDGSGVPPELAQSLFDPFRSGRPEGTGLGLALAHRLMESMGGNVKLTETGPEGTRMVLELPASAESAAIHRESSARGVSP